MMKKVVFALIILLTVLLFPLFAELRIDMVPYQGFSGIPVGTNYFKGTGTKYSGIEDFPWADMQKKYGSSQDASSLNPTYEYYYTDKEMIALVALQNYSSSGQLSSDKFDFKGPITITVTAPNGLYLESQSDPYYRRPIELWLYPSYMLYYYSSDHKGVAKKNGEEYFKHVSNSSPTITILDGKKESIAAVWFDVVLVLPGTLNEETNEIVLDDGTRYPLKDADDYSCLVTISAEYYDTTNSKTITNSITIPFSGYYDSSKTAQTIADNSVSMNIEMDAKAYNIDIDSERGKDIRIGNISFVGSAGSFSSTEVNAAIFFSSSSSAFTKGSEFAMVLDSLAVNEGRTSRNSIPFTLKVQNGTGDGYITFDGTTYALSSWDSIDSFNAGKFVIPQTDAGTSFLNLNKGVRYFKRYESEIVLQLESNDITMIQGRYEGEIYVHVVTV